MSLFIATQAILNTIQWTGRRQTPPGIRRGWRQGARLAKAAACVTVAPPVILNPP